MAIVLYFLLTFISQATCIRIEEYGKDQFKIIQDNLGQIDQKQEITSFYLTGDSVLTLEMTFTNLITLASYHFPSMKLVQRLEYHYECERPLIVCCQESVICQNTTGIYKVNTISQKQDRLNDHIQGKYNIVGIFHDNQQSRDNIEIYYENNKSLIKCMRFDLKLCQTNLENIIGDILEKEIVFIKIQKFSSLLITRSPNKSVQNNQEFIRQSKLKRFLNNYPELGTYPGGSNIATLNIPLGTTQDIIYPSIVDESPNLVSVNQNYQTVPYSSEITQGHQYRFAPPQSAFELLGSYLMTVTLEDSSNQVTNYSYTIVYTNYAPYFSPAPTISSITTRFSQQKTLALPTMLDNEGHSVTFTTSLPSSIAFITYDSGTRSFIVNPQAAGQCGTTVFTYYLTDSNMNSADYSMTVIVTNLAPDFSATPTLNLNLSPFNYQLHVMGKLSISLPSLSDPDGGQVVLNPSDTPGRGSSALVLSHDSTNQKLIIQSTQIQNCGSMNPLTHFGKSTHVIQMRIQDLCSLYTDYQISVDVYNTAPHFIPSGFTISPVELPMNSVKQIDISTNIFDPDIDSINIGLAQMINYVPKSVPPMFKIIAPATINIQPTTFAEVGLYKLRVEIYDYQPYSSFTYFDVNVTNDAPVFLKNQTMQNKRLHFNNTYEYLLPPYADPEGSQVFVSHTSSSQPDLINQFAKLQPLINPDRIIIYPNAWNYIGTYSIITKLTDSNNATYYPWTLEIFNTPPYFNGNKKPANQKLRFNSTIRYQLPKFSDDEFNTIIVINKMPKFITFDSVLSTYVITPTHPVTDIGTFLVQGKLSDTQMELDFKFQVSVFNDPPIFKQPLISNVRVVVGSNYTYILPEAEDREGMSIFISSQINSVSGLMPSFIKFSPAQRQFDFSPDKLTQIGNYDIQVILKDIYSQQNVYQFRLNVEDPTKMKKNAINGSIGSDSGSGTKSDFELVQANFKIISVSRDRKCKIKILALKGGDYLTELITYETFKIVILTKKNQPVSYTIDSKDSKQNIVTLQLNFKDPSNISNTTEFDRIEFKVEREPQFKSKVLLCLIPFETKQQASVPPQVNSAAASFAAIFKGGVQVLPQTSSVGMAGNLSISFIIQYIWGLLNDMSFLTINAMISITVPGTAKLIQMAFLNFIYLDILQTDKWLIPFLFKQDQNSTQDIQDLDQLESADQDGPLNDYFDENGFSNKYLIKNLGSTFVFFVLLLFSLILVPILSPLEKWSMIKRFSLWLKKRMIWNFTLRFLFQQAPPISIGCGINLYLLKFSTFDGTSISSVLSLIFIFCLCVGKVFVYLILKKYQRTKMLESEQFQSRYGTLVDGLNLSNNIGVYWNLLILFRWSLTNTFLIIQRDHNYGQILCLLVFSLLFQVLMVFGKPYNDKLENQINLFNEVMVSAYLYVLMMLTDFQGENPYRIQQGIVLVVIIVINVSLNVIKLLYSVLKKLWIICLKKKLERIQAQKLAQERKHLNELIRFQEEIVKILSNSQLLDPNYIPTIEEEQALANRRLLFQGHPINMNPELGVLFEKINRMRFGLNEKEIQSGFGRIINNWKGNKQKYQISSELPIQISQCQMSMKKTEQVQFRNVSIFNPKNEVTRENIKSLFKKQKKRVKKSKNKNFPINNNHNQRSEWIFEDDYNANQLDNQYFKSGDTSITLSRLHNTFQKHFEHETTQENHIKSTTMNLIEEEIKQKNEKAPQITFRNNNQTNTNIVYEREQWKRY